MSEGTNDKVFIEDLKIQLRIGCTEEERAFPQQIVVNLEAALDLSKSATTKNLSDTVCYVSMAQMCKEVAVSKNWVLIEEYGQELASNILQAFPLVDLCRITIRKFVLPEAKSAGIFLERRRPKGA